jgi:hypothetical protein
MALSPNYGWAEPDNSSLVKNGAQDIRALGDAIDTSVWNVGYGQAGKNKIINGDFGIWQRGTSFSNPVNGAYVADRFNISYNGTGATRTISQQTFTPGTAPVAGYEGQYFLRYDQSVAGTGGGFQSFRHYVENVQTFAGQTVTFSYFAKAAAGVTLSAPLIRQNFGSGGSTQVDTLFSSGSTLTTSWQRFSHTISVPSISGKTIGAGSYLSFSLALPFNTTFTIDLWGMQAEYGSKATPFQTATGTIQGELAACQRYYYRQVANTSARLGIGHNSTTTLSEFSIPFPVTMRTAPTALEQSGTATDYSVRSTNFNTTCSAVPAIATGNNEIGNFAFTVASGLTGGNGSFARSNATGAFLGWSAEL